ncbi:MAG: H-NS histone family protein [Defluviimonas sp.]|nr:H-NS histone family protein [Defluviimonas sp.]
MDAFNLDDLSLKELHDLQAQVARAIASFEDRKKNEALSALEETAQEYGFSLAELTGVQLQKKRKSAAPKFANPANRSQTWTGRGRRPRWIEAALKDGKSLEDLAI